VSLQNDIEGLKVEQILHLKMS